MLQNARLGSVNQPIKMPLRGAQQLAVPHSWTENRTQGEDTRKERSRRGAGPLAPLPPATHPPPHSPSLPCPLASCLPAFSPQEKLHV